MSIRTHLLGLLALFLLLPAVPALGTCRDTVVLVHGNTGSPTDFQNTYNLLRQQGWSDAKIVTPSWANKYCAAGNDHNGSEETPVKSAIAISCSGHIDVIGHSMGETLAMREIDKLHVASKVDVFIGSAGAVHGL